MKSASVLLCSVASVGIATGCASSGDRAIKDQTQASVAATLTEGVTTKADVQAHLGSPSGISFTDSGREIWTYKYQHATSHAQNFVPFVNWFTNGADVDTKQLVILFNDQGVVSKYTLNESQNVVKRGVAE